MRIGIPKELKTLEGRVGLIPPAVAQCVKQGHQVFVQADAGQLSGYKNEDFIKAGATVVDTAQMVYERCELVVKVKEPIDADLQYLTDKHTIFCYLHLAANAALTKRLQTIGLTAVAFETVEVHGGLPLLAPMSDIAGRLSVQIGVQLLYHHQGGKGIMLGGLPGVERGKVTVLGAGVAGSNAARVAAQLGCKVVVFARRRDQQERMRELGPNVEALYPFEELIAQHLLDTDLLIGAILIPGAKAPQLVTSPMVKSMQTGSVIVDIAVDQGGCIETIKPTNYADPTYVWEGITHFAVTNMPGAVPRTSSQALSSSILPFVLKMAQKEWGKDPNLHSAINVQKGKIVHPALK